MRTVGSRLICLAVLACAAAVPSQQASAQVEVPEGAEPTEEELARARQLFFEGISLEAAENWSEALRKFERVATVRLTYQVRFHMARCKEKLGRLTEALGDYELAAYAARQADSEDAEEIARARDRLRRRIPKLDISVSSSGEAVEVYLDGVELGDVRSPVPVDPGARRLRAVSGERVVNKTVEAKEGETVQVRLSFPAQAEETQQAPPEATGSSLPVLAWVSGGVAVGSLAASGVLWGLRQDRLGRIEGLCGPDFDCRGLDAQDRSLVLEADSQGRTFTQASAGTLAAGLALGVTSGVLFFVEARRQRRTQSSGTSVEVTVLPIISSERMGVQMSGRF